MVYDTENGFLKYSKNEDFKSKCWHCMRPLVVGSGVCVVILCIPFYPIENGILSHGTIPLTAFLSILVSTYTLIINMRHCFPDTNISDLDGLKVCVFGGMNYVVVLCLLALVICYPFPFSLVAASMGYMPLTAMFCFWLLKNRLKKEKQLLKSTTTLLLFLNSTMLMSMAYPFYFQQYHVYRDKYPFAANLCLSMAQVMTRQVLKFALYYHQLPIPYVTFAVNAFHTIYISITLQDQNTLSMLFVLIVINSMSNVFSIVVIQRVQQKMSTKINSLSVKDVKLQNISTPPQESQLFKFTSDLVLVEYIEAVVPILYSILSLLFFVHPNGRFMSAFRPEVFTAKVLSSTLTSLLLYATVEVLWFVFLAQYVYKKCNLSLFTQLGYLLHDQTYSASAYLFTWILYAIMGTFDQFGHDWTFSFDWQCS